LLARTEMRLALEEWLKHIPEFTLVGDAIRYAGGITASIDKVSLAWDPATTKA
jgi:cytochrome P450